MSEAGAGSLLRALETRHAERLSLVTGFLKGGVDLCRLRAKQLAADGRARRRAAGLRTLRSLLGSTGREGSSGVKAALLLYVPPALRGVLHGLAALGPDPIALQVRLCIGTVRHGRLGVEGGRIDGEFQQVFAISSGR